jgi:spermidine/putrescine transport system permease protein
VPAEANVVASAVFILAILIVVSIQVGGSIREKRLNRIK